MVYVFMNIGHHKKGFNMAKFSLLQFSFEVQLDYTVLSVCAADYIWRMIQRLKCLQTVHITTGKLTTEIYSKLTIKAEQETM